MFCSINELDKFSYDDCVINSFKVLDNSITLELEALVVKANNSQNSNYTESYADVTVMRLVDAKIERIILAGYKVYDADDNLLEEIPDKEIEADGYDEIISKLSGAYLYRVLQMDKIGDKEIYDFEIEFESGEQMQDLRNDTYVLSIAMSKSEVSWDRYLNRVQH